jgi:hypothetical protein
VTGTNLGNLEPAIGLEPMTCQLRTTGEAKAVDFGGYERTNYRRIPSSVVQQFLPVSIG